MTWSTDSVATQSKKQKGKPNTLRRSRKHYSGRKFRRPSERHHVSLRRHSKKCVPKIPSAEVASLKTSNQDKDWALSDWLDDEEEEPLSESSFVRDSWVRKPFKIKMKSKDDVTPDNAMVLDFSLMDLPLQSPKREEQVSESQSDDFHHTHSREGRDLPEGKSIKSLLGVKLNVPEKEVNVSTKFNSQLKENDIHRKVQNQNKDERRDEVCDIATSVQANTKFNQVSSRPIDHLISGCISPSTAEPPRQVPRSTSSSHEHTQLCTAEVHPIQPQCLYAEGKNLLPAAKTIECTLEWNGDLSGCNKEQIMSENGIGGDPESISLSDIKVSISVLTETLKTIDFEHCSSERPTQQDISHRGSISSASSATNSTSVSTMTDHTTSTGTTMHSNCRSRLSGLSKYSISAKRPHTKRIRACVARRPRKILVLGDMMSGKTNLISTYSMDRYQDQYIPTLLRCVQADATLQGENIDLVVLDISGRDDFAPLRKYAYHKVDAVMLCYPVNSIDSFERIRTYWVRELKEHAPKASFVVVGTKKDIRDEARHNLELLKRTLQGSEKEMEGRIHLEAEFAEKFVSFDRGKRLSNEIGAQNFYECSSMYREGTRDLFESVAMMAMQKSRRKRRTSSRHVDNMCTIL